jgi:hypothetical protein
VTVTPPPAATNGSPPSRVTVVFPSGREHIWVSGASAAASWEIGQIVLIRKSEWRVVDRRVDGFDAVTVTLDPVQ